MENELCLTLLLLWPCLFPPDNHFEQTFEWSCSLSIWGPCTQDTRKNTFVVPSSENSVPCLNFEFSRPWITFVSSEVVEIFSSAISFLGHWDYLWSSLVAQRLKCLPAVWETHVWSLGQEDPWRRKWQPT